MSNLNLKENQFAVGKAEFKTGHVLNNDGTIYYSGSEESKMYEIGLRWWIRKTLVANVLRAIFRLRLKENSIFHNRKRS